MKSYTVSRRWDHFQNSKTIILTLRTYDSQVNRDFNLSVPIARVGRIISDLIAKNKVKSVAFVTGKKVSIKKRKFNKHGKKWKYGMKSKQPGEMVQLDNI